MRALLLLYIAVLLIGCTSIRPTSSPLTTGERVVAPHGWTDYQARDPLPIPPDEKWVDLLATQRRVKERFHYSSDMDLYGSSEFWTVMQDSYRGDCEDFALTCGKLLMNKGWPPSERRPACVVTETGGHHAVLVAEICGNAYVLDNRQKQVKAWRDLPYRWEKILDKGGKFWVRIEEGR